MITKHQEIPVAVEQTEHGATLLVATDTLRKLAEILIAPDRLNRPDLTIEIA